MRKRSWITVLVLLVTVLSMGCSQKTNAPAASPSPSPAPAAPAQPKEIDWPKEPINVQIGYAPGGGSDVMLSMVRPGLEKVLKTTLVPVYKPGAGSDIALTDVSKAKPDGYNIVVTTTPYIFVNPMVRQTQYKGPQDFALTANVVTDPGIIAVRTESPFKTFKDYIDAAKASPGKITVGVSAAPGDDWFAAMMTRKQLGVNINVVVFSGDGPSWQAALGGQVDLTYNNLGIVYPQIKGGKLRALAVMSEKRSDFLPDVPTLKELGANITSFSARGFAFPKGTPKEIVDKFTNAVKQVMETQEFKDKAKETAFPADYQNPDQMTKSLENMVPTYKALWDEYRKEAGDVK